MEDYEDKGEISINEADDANIPVDIWLTRKTDENGDTIEDGDWDLKASNYMPRKCRVTEEAYLATSKDRKVLEGLVRTHWLPLYQAAVKVLTEFRPNKDGISRLYYWNDSKEI